MRVEGAHDARRRRSLSAKVLGHDGARRVINALSSARVHSRIDETRVLALRAPQRGLIGVRAAWRVNEAHLQKPILVVSSSGS